MQQPVSLSLKKTRGCGGGADGFPVAVLNRNQPAFYCVPAAAYEALMDKLENMELACIVAQRQEDPEVEVSIDEL